MKPRHLLAAVAICAAAVSAHAMPGASQGTGTRIEGEVLEVVNASTYTYLRLKTKDGETWAAVSSANVAKGAKVAIDDAMVMQNFESKAMKRKFDRLVLGSLASGGTKNAVSPHGVAPSAPAAPVGKIARAKAADGKTVAEVVGGKAALKDKSVTIRGQVVKVSTGVLGKNWLHLQDGSGSAADGSNDIVVTTRESAAVGDVVDARGTVRTGVNLGSGYVYAVLVEDAKLKK